MNWYTLSLTITAYLSSDHPKYQCFLYADVNGKAESKTLDIDTANKLMWQLKAKGWETRATAEYNTFSPHIYTRNIRWLHLD